jgi:hypothetical protein
MLLLYVSRTVDSSRFSFPYQAIPTYTRTLKSLVMGGNG